MKRRMSFGPGLLVTAAFIGPGTITTATLAGAGFGFTLLWALVFSIAATIVLQEMSARLGLVTRKGLGEALRTTFTTPVARITLMLLVVSAIALGNCAFQTGNIIGAAMGLEMLTGVNRSAGALMVGLAAFSMLAVGGYRLIERMLMALVAVMGVVFILTAIVSRPGLTDVLKGLLVPSIPHGSLVTIIALIGTTVVPYNLFLHAGAVTRKWPATTSVRISLREARWDGALSIALGGLISLAVMATAAAFTMGGAAIDGPAAMAEPLRPLLGAAGRPLFAVGLVAAGLTSAITAPLAAAYATTGVLGWDSGLQTWKFRAVWATVIAVGTTLAMMGGNPISAILFAQAANGWLLPIIAGFLLVAMNRKALLGDYTNRVLANVLGAGVVLVVSGLGFVKLVKVARAIWP
ncbi:MAG: Nramp family divalent metal transporter [Planctomycetes bacterium]|nr:Nramp family divalent metal transporter [Planctomycetota bacterium]